jgi:hypothetical protein
MMPIRATITGLALLLMTATSGADTAYAQGLGISAGLNFSQLSDIDTGDQRATFDNASGWHVHLWLDLPIGAVAIRPGVRYMDAGDVFESGSLSGAAESIDATLLEVPVDVRFRLPLPLLTPYVMAGPVLRFPMSDDGERFRSVSVAGGAGVGLELSLGGMTLYPELKYTFGLTSYTEESYELGGVTFAPGSDQHLNAVMLSIGISL